MCQNHGRFSPVQVREKVPLDVGRRDTEELGRSHFFGREIQVLRKIRAAQRLQPEFITTVVDKQGFCGFDRCETWHERRSYSRITVGFTEDEREGNHCQIAFSSPSCATHGSSVLGVRIGLPV